MKINCLSCGHKVDLDDSYDDFEGQIKCFACGALLNVNLSEGCVKSVKIAEQAGGMPPAERQRTKVKHEG